MYKVLSDVFTTYVFPQCKGVIFVKYFSMCKCFGIIQSFAINIYEGKIYKVINEMIMDDIVPNIIILTVLCQKDKLQDTQNKNKSVITIDIMPVDINSSVIDTLSR